MLKMNYLRLARLRLQLLKSALCLPLILFIVLYVTSYSSLIRALFTHPTEKYHGSAYRTNLPGRGNDRTGLTRQPEGCYIYGKMSLGEFQLLNSTEMRKRSCRQRLPKAIVIGIKKGGTSALRDFLRYHPQVAFAPDEVHYFTAPGFRLDLDAYRGKMAYSTPGQLTMEKTPAYFYHPKAPQRISKALPSVKLILVFRDPVERAVSDYVQLTTKPSGLAHQPPKNRSDVKVGLGWGYRLRKTFKESVTNSDGSLVTQNHLLVKGRYVYFLQRWLQFFLLDRILILDGNAFAKNPLPTLRIVEEFLQITPFFTEEHVAFNKEKGFYCLEKPLPNNCLPANKGRPHPKIPTRILRKLKQYYEPYNRKLNQLLNRTFEWWT